MKFILMLLIFEDAAEFSKFIFIWQYVEIYVSTLTAFPPKNCESATREGWMDNPEVDLDCDDAVAQLQRNRKIKNKSQEQIVREQNDAFHHVRTVILNRIPHGYEGRIQKDEFVG